MNQCQRTKYNSVLVQDELAMLKEELELKEADIRKLQENVNAPLGTESKGTGDKGEGLNLCMSNVLQPAWKVEQKMQIIFVNQRCALQ